MRSCSRTAFWTLLSVALAVLPAAAVEIEGQVRNLTTGQPVAGASVSLLALRGMMIPIRETQTDDAGRFRFVVAANPNERFLVQVPYRGVNYNAAAGVTGGDRLTVNVDVYDAGATDADLSVENHTILLEPHEDHLRISEYYGVRNQSQPPRSYAPDRGGFTFALPPGIGDLGVSTRTSAGMPLRQQVQAAEQENQFYLDYALRPGETEIQISYVLPMEGTEANLRLPQIVETKTRNIAVPAAGVTATGPDLEEIQQNRIPQVRLYSVKMTTTGNLALNLQVDPEALQQAQAAAPPQQPADPQNQVAVSIISHPVSQAQGYILGLGLLVLLVGLYYLYSHEPAHTARNDASRQSTAKSH